MKSKTYNFAVDKAVYTGFLDIQEFTSTVCDKSYYNYIIESQERIDKSNIDLTGINDIFLRRRLLEYLIISMEERIINPTSFLSYRIRPLKRILYANSELFKLPYTEFVTNGLSELENIYHCTGSVLALLHTFQKYCYDAEHSENRFESDIWYLSDFAISNERNASLRLKKLNFFSFKNDKNKYYAKKYTEYMITNTDNTVNTIFGRLSALKILLSDSNVPFDEWTDEYTDSEIAKLIEKYSNKRSLASRMITYYHFTDFLLLHDFIDVNPIKKYRSLLCVGTFKHTTNTVPDSVIMQIFKVLGKIEDEWAVLMFLMLYCVGMRVSEACAIKRDCLEKTPKGEFLKYYSLKMKKEVCNVIPEALYNMIYQYRTTHSSTHSDYLFPSQKNASVPVAPYRLYVKLNAAFEKYNVRNPDGSIYHFKPHSFRHNMAVEMRKRDIPFEIIQEQLHHSSPEMTLAYVEYIDRDIIRKMDSYIDAAGNPTPFDNIFSENKEYAEYMRKSINAQLLPNGLCARPVALGNCPHANACLSCPEFRTSKAYLEVHKRHLQKVEEYITIAKQNGWLPQVESNKVTQKLLIEIIHKLESEG